MAATSMTVVDDERIRVTTWAFETAGDATGWHVHQFDYLVVPVTGGAFAVVGPGDERREMTQEAGAPYLGSAGTEHDVVFAGQGRASFVEIELKRRAP